MNNNVIKLNQGSMPPMSSEDIEIAQTMLQTGMMNAPVMPGPIGAVDRFEVIKLLGRGGMGQVMLAREPITDASVAIKIIHPKFAKEQEAVRRFLTEAQHMYRMSHPNILKVLEVSDRKAGPYYVMPYIEEGSLAERIKPGQPLPKDEIVPIARQIADALKYAHSRGIIHRDLKPANILFDAAGHAYLTDFGLLRTVFNDSLIDVNKKSVEGTAPYLSPSAAEGKAGDTRCDIYAFGAVLYEMLTGRRPYDGPDPTVIIKKIIAGPPPPVHEVNPEAPADLVRIAENCMARELRDRYAEMADVLRDIERLSAGENILGPHGTSSEKGAINFWKKFLIYIGVGCGVFALLFLVNAIFGVKFGFKPGTQLWHRLWQPAGFFEPTLGTRSMTHNVRLLPNGDAILTSDWYFKNKGDTPMLTYSFIVTPSNIVAVLDKHGNALPFDVTREDNTRYNRYTVRLQSPLLPGEEFIGKIIFTRPMAAKITGDTWIYRNTLIPGPETRFSETVLLPEGAEIISVNPKPSRQMMERRSIALVLEKQIAKGGAYMCEIRYRLAGTVPNAMMK